METRSRDTYLEKLATKAESTRQNFNITYESFDRFCQKRFDRGADNLYSGTITFDRTTGTGAFEIVALFVCDMVIGTTGGDSLAQTYAIFGGDSITDTNGNVRDNTLQETLLANECADISNDGGNLERLLFLGGDEDNNLVLTFVETDADNEDDADGATVVAYVVGLSAATDLTITSTTAVT